MFSGVALNPWVFSPVPRFAERVAVGLGFNGTTETQLIDFLEKQTPALLVKAREAILSNEEKYGFLTEVVPGPVVEPSWSTNPFLSSDPVVAARSAWSNNIDAVFVTNSFEGLYQAMRENRENGEDIKKVIAHFTANSAYFTPLTNLKLNSASPQAKIYGGRIRDV
jgi:Carboxylesterase family